MNKKEILQVAFDEGRKYIGENLNLINDLAEWYVEEQTYESIEMDDEIYIAFVDGATSK